MSNQKLKPCPFCGGEAVTDFMAGFSYLIECRDCNASIGAEDSEDAAVDVWNSRATAVVAIPDEARLLISNLSLLVARMARRLRREKGTVGDAGDRALADQAVEFLQRKGLTSPLRINTPSVESAS